MGWNSWNTFRCNINESLIKQVADALVDTGLAEVGFKYVNIDDCWMEKRAPDGSIQPFQDKFPSGMKALVDYVHSKGLLFGLYSDAGNKTCEGYPGSWGHEVQDAKTYASWGVDYLKYDYCAMDDAHETVQASYERMRDALAASGRRVLFSMCSWGHGEPWKWGRATGNSWRIAADVFAVWDAATAKALRLPSFLIPVMASVEAAAPLAAHAGPGGFNDPDMLVVGLDGMYPYGIVDICPEHVVGCTPGQYISREKWGSVGGLTQSEQRTHFAFWCMLASPLILGNDPRRVSTATLQILLARELIAINQDPLAKQAERVIHEGDVQIWRKQLSGSRAALMLFNAGSRAVDITAVWAHVLPDEAQRWARNPAPSPPVGCVDAETGCPEWAKAGECEKNPGFMLDRCKVSCPRGCQRSAPVDGEGPKATATVRDAWQQETLGAFQGHFTAHLVEPHAARVIVVQFVEPGDAAELAADQAHATDLAAAKHQLLGGGITDKVTGASKADRSSGGSSGVSSGSSPVAGDSGASGPDARMLLKENTTAQLEVQVEELMSELEAARKELGLLKAHGGALPLPRQQPQQQHRRWWHRGPAAAAGESALELQERLEASELQLGSGSSTKVSSVGLGKGGGQSNASSKLGDRGSVGGAGARGVTAGRGQRMELRMGARAGAADSAAAAVGTLHAVHTTSKVLLLGNVLLVLAVLGLLAWMRPRRHAPGGAHGAQQPEHLHMQPPGLLHQPLKARGSAPAGGRGRSFVKPPAPP